MKKTRVLIVEDSAVVRELLRHVIAQDVRLEVAAAVSSAEEALRILHRVRPDVISLDIWLAGMDGFQATRRIMSEKPTPIVIVSGEGENLQTRVRALEAGALTVLEKPAGISQSNYDAMAECLCTQLVIMSQVNVVRQRGCQGAGLPKGSRKPGLPFDGLAPNESFRSSAMLGIASSTGGPAALMQLLGGLGRGFPLPILLVQHMAAHFLEGFAAWLEDISPFTVVVLKNGETPAPGKIYIAPPGRHLRAAAGHVLLDSSPPVCAERPSGTVLFRSMAENLASDALAVLLTGMGEDGAQGLLDVRVAGGYTIAEDQSTATVYGMPAAAVRMGAVCESLPVTGIAPRILDLVTLGRDAF